MANNPGESPKTTIKLGEFTKKGKKVKVYSLILKTTAIKLGVQAFDAGERLIAKIKKGKATGAQYSYYREGGSAATYVLYFATAKKFETKNGKQVAIYHEKVTLPTPAGTPLAVVAEFCQKLKRKPLKIETPGGKVHHLNNSKAAQGI
jgi:hypothetical protein